MFLLETLCNTLTPVFPVFRRLGQEEGEFEISLGYMVNPGQHRLQGETLAQKALKENKLMRV